MTDRTADQTRREAAGANPSRRPRKWRNRQPASRRLDLTPEEAEQAEARKRQGQRKAFIGAFVTDAEKATIAKRAERYGIAQSNFIRTVLLSDLKEPPPPKTDPAALRALAFELSKLGTNLNQLAHRANEAAKISADAKLRTMERMEAELSALSAQIAAAVERVISL